MNSLANLMIRIVLFVLCIAGIAMSPRNGTNLDWSAALIIAVVAGIGQFLWLLSKRSSADAKWANLLSWREPFFPMQRYPFRFWLFSGQCLMAGGVLAMGVDDINATGNIAYGATFFFLGLATLVSSVLVLRGSGTHG